MGATMKLSLTFAVLLLLLSGLMVFGDAEVTCGTMACIEGGHVTCKNYPGKKFNGCDCVCAPKDGKDCVLHLHFGHTKQCTN